MKEKPEQVQSDVLGGGLGAMLVMRAALTDGIFIHARRLTNLVKLTWKLPALCIPSQICCQLSGSYCKLELPRNHNMNKLGMMCLIYSAELLICA